MEILYKVLSIVISLFAAIFALALLFIIPVSLAVPPLWLPTFLIAAIILYTWFSNKFQKQVLVRHETVKASLRDWIRVNGFVAIGFSILNITSMLALLRNPGQYIAQMKEAFEQLGPEYEQKFKPENLSILAVIMTIYMIALLIHVLWTFSLLKKHQEHFQ